MTRRVTPTLAICAIGALGAAAGLFLPARQLSAATPGSASAVQQDSAELALQPTTQTVSIENFSFGGASVAKPGEHISVSNLDGVTHTMTANDGSFDTRNLNGGSTVTLAIPNEPGTYQFFCSIHPSMVSTITVQP